MDASPGPLQAFGDYRIDAVARRLLDAAGNEVALTSRVFDLLLYLVQHRDRVVTKDELLSAVWAGRVVEENTLAQAISTLRRALGSGAGDRRYIVTVPGRGYRFVAAPPAPPDQAAETARNPPADDAGIGQPGPRRLYAVLAGLAALLAILAIAVPGFRGREASAIDPERAPATLAVLPFPTIGGGQRDDMLELGMADTLISRLSGSTQLRVLALGAVDRFAGSAVDAQRTGRTLGADYIVAGSVQRQGDTIRVNARLIESQHGRTLWAGTFDETPERIFTLQDAMAERMASALSLQHTPAIRHRSACDGADAQAYRAYLRGRHLMNRPQRTALPEAIASLQQAVERDPQCARAWAAIAFARRALVMTADGQPGQVFPQAKVAVANALRIDPDSAEAYASRGFIEFWYDWDWAASERSLRHAIALNDDSPEAHFGLAHLLNNTGRLDEALPYARKATVLDPMAPIINAVAASFFINDGQVEEGERRLHRVLQTDPEFWVALHWRGILALRAGRYDEALRTFERASASCEGCSIAEAMRARVHALRGEPAAADAIRQSLLRRRDSGYVPATRIATLHLALGERDAALDELERAYRERDLHMTFLAIDPGWRPLYGDPRFEALLRAMELPRPGH